MARFLAAKNKAHGITLDSLAQLQFMMQVTAPSRVSDQPILQELKPQRFAAAESLVKD